MTETTPPTPEQKQITNRAMAQYIRDLSFENILAQKGVTGEVQPEVTVQVATDARKRGADNQFEVITKLNVTSKNKGSGDPLFILELDYAGVFIVEGVPDEQMLPFLLIECARVSFPFIRRIVSDVTRDGGFPPLNLETIDYVSIYRAKVSQVMEEQKAKAN
ncbi:MAG: protein-export chaperone SecB [Limimaricola sp.]|uniref:protein-export chaperone SecB n=1 Tax=Limimaricola sp. TaxID=2211665 RepID=UPI001DC695D7|nr:protein-export chaperone SecB [Limimaricola sp.]MBI1417226.1 protein-export chaperone SecB [Limimaricola sp.]